MPLFADSLLSFAISQPIHLVCIFAFGLWFLRACFPLRIPHYERQKAFHVGFIDLVEAPLEGLHQLTFKVEEPVTAVVYVFFGDWTVGFDFESCLTSEFARPNICPSTA